MSPTPYKPYYSDVFIGCLEAYHQYTDQALELVERICNSPTTNSHFLKKKKRVDLRGKRRRHMSGNYVVIYIVCEECVRMSHRAKGYNNCSFCEDAPPSDRIIFCGFGKWDSIYSCQWEV